MGYKGHNKIQKGCFRGVVHLRDIWECVNGIFKDEGKVIKQVRAYMYSKAGSLQTIQHMCVCAKLLQSCTTL